MSELEQRVTDLEAQVRCLEAGLTAMASSPGSVSPAVEAPQAAPDIDEQQSDPVQGTIGYQGNASWGGGVQWKIRWAAEGIAALPLPSAAGVLNAIGHPGRAAIVRTLLTAPATAAELQESAALNSAGQLYHHLRTLTAAGLVEQDGRGRYRVPGAKLIPVSVLLLAASDIAGALQ
ncbi:ArsR/SmtB family transcription factor [Actinoalloteichus hymeniacidonis]|uniref:Transcriptional regulator n=1 Tax=Actinoalloteichus hymeniacidonis TaxID=340345 RepID=A0AAC9HS39_9PSEU|nr:winged helix-turn-helix domain-containing protein [Actinoalloteichus hymeniacidonis]AOS64388.1 putative transcriptional regulator [Actinoalloteichus hymeniacidonis]MBB5907544.1 DNA-binding transcriptional ArsR family regulator [Actinoalloteichus hymeniacidonis]